MATIGLARLTPPSEPWNTAVPKLNTPPAEETIQYPVVPAGARPTIGELERAEVAWTWAATWAGAEDPARAAVTPALGARTVDRALAARAAARNRPRANRG